MNNKDEIKKNAFLANIKKYDEAGLVKLLYVNDYFAIVNYGNIGYLCCPYIIFNNEMEQYGLNMPKHSINTIISDPVAFYKLLSSSSVQQVQASSVDLSPLSYDATKDFIEKFDYSSYSSDVDLSFDEKLLKKYEQEKNKENRNGLFSFFRRGR